jgi:hypothetical protein
MDAKRVINGTWGKIWLDGDILADCYGLQAKADIKKEDVPICGKLGTSKKMVSWEGKGSLKFNKVRSIMAIKIQNMLKNGQEVVCTVVSELDDPDAYGAERVAINNVSFDDLTLADFENAKNGQVEAPFTFDDFDYLDLINIDVNY